MNPLICKAKIANPTAAGHNYRPGSPGLLYGNIRTRPDSFGIKGLPTGKAGWKAWRRRKAGAAASAS